MKPEIFWMIPDGYKEISYAYDDNTKLYLRKYDSGAIQLVPVWEYNKVIESYKMLLDEFNEKKR